ncbi:MAG: AAA family ATPase [Alkaliphilus sp.]
MIEKIIEIKNTGKFLNYSFSGGARFEKATLIYSENGRGKTTLSAIFRSLRNNDSNLILGRKTLGLPGSPRVSVLIDGETYEFNNSVWNKTFESIEIFDETFVDENVFSGCYIETNHKRNLCSFVIGEKGVELARLIEDIADQIKKVNGQIKEKENQVRSFLEGRFTLEGFARLKPIPDIESAIKRVKKEIEELNKAAEILKKPELKTLSVPSVPLEKIKNMLSKTIKDISQEAIVKTKMHIDKCIGAAGEEWISSGTRYIKDDKCPFCGKCLEGNELIESYQAYFNTAYKKLKGDIAEFDGGIRRLFSEDKLLQTQKIITTNELLVDYWGKETQNNWNSIIFEEMKKEWYELKEVLGEHLKRKIAAPLEVIEFSEELEALVEKFGRIERRVSDDNIRIKQFNNYIAKRKEGVSKGNLAKLQDQLLHFNDNKRRFSEKGKKFCEDFEKLQKEKERLKRQKETKKNELDRYVEEMFRQYEGSINQYLEKIGADFKIAKLKVSYPAGRPSSEYGFKIDDNFVKLGSPKTLDAIPSFKNTLSSGDKSTLAFAFFIAKIYQENNLPDKIIVIDDPISSLDKHRRFMTEQTIAHCFQDAKQVIVLSHDSLFLFELWKRAKDISDSRQALIIKRTNNDYSSIGKWEIEAENMEEYFRVYSKVSSYIEAGVDRDDERRHIAKSIRILLEFFLKYKYPQEFSGKTNLGDILRKIQQAGAGDQISNLQPEIQELHAINEYARRYHHPGAASEPINDGELRSWAARVVSFISKR